MTKICSNCGHANRDAAVFCKGCGFQLPTIIHKAPGQSGMEKLGHSLGVGASLFPTALFGGAVGGFALTFVGVYLYIGIPFGRDLGDGGLVPILITLIFGSFILIPISAFVAVFGGIVGLIMGFITGGAGFVISLLTTWMPDGMRTLTMVATMIIVGAIGGYLGYTQVSDDPGNMGTWVTIGGAVFGLIQGIIAAGALSPES